MKILLHLSNKTLDFSVTRFTTVRKLSCRYIHHSNMKILDIHFRPAVSALPWYWGEGQTVNNELRPLCGAYLLCRGTSQGPGWAWRRVRSRSKLHDLSSVEQSRYSALCLRAQCHIRGSASPPWRPDEKETGRLPRPTAQRLWITRWGTWLVTPVFPTPSRSSGGLRRTHRPRKWWRWCSCGLLGRCKDTRPASLLLWPWEKKTRMNVRDR